MIVCTGIEGNARIIVDWIVAASVFANKMGEESGQRLISFSFWDPKKTRVKETFYLKWTILNSLKSHKIVPCYLVPNNKRIVSGWNVSSDRCWLVDSKLSLIYTEHGWENYKNETASFWICKISWKKRNFSQRNKFFFKSCTMICRKIYRLDASDNP